MEEKGLRLLKQLGLCKNIHTSLVSVLIRSEYDL